MKDDAFSAAYRELLQTLSLSSPPLYRVEKVKIRQRKKSPARAFPVDQKSLNKQIESAIPFGWDVRPLVVPPGRSGPATNIRSDFKKARIQVEIQFGNMARWYTDVFKFQLAYSLDDIDVGILVVPTHKFANLIDENVASYERVLRELPWAKMSLTLPILVIGVEPDDYTEVRTQYDLACEAYLAKPENVGKSTRRFEEAIVAAEEEADDQ